MNSVVLTGRLTKAPEERTTQSGIAVTTFTIAVNRNRDKEKADFFNIVTWRGLAESCAKFLVKGQQVTIAGEIQNRSYEAQDGTKRYITEIQADKVEFGAKPNGQAQPTFEEEMGEVVDSEEELPF